MSMGFYLGCYIPHVPRGHGQMAALMTEWVWPLVYPHDCVGIAYWLPHKVVSMIM